MVSPQILIERRFAKTLGVKEDEMQAIALTKSEHQQFTNRWRELIGHDDDISAIVKTSTATVEQIYNAAKEVYKDYPTILKALGLK